MTPWMNRHWEGPSGIREVLAVALPMMVSTLSWTVMQFADRMFLMWYSADAVAAVLPANALSFAMICFPLGIAVYVNTFVAQYFGAGRHDRVGLAVWQGVWVGVITIPIVIATIPLAPAMFALSGHTPEVIELEVIYYQTVSAGIGFLVIGMAFSSFFSGLGWTRTVMIVDCLAAVIDIALDYAWIFGKWGFPEMGVAGAGWTTSVGFLIKAVVFGAIFLRPKFQRQFGTWAGCRFDAELFKRLLRFGSPNGVQFLFEVLGFTLFVFIVGWLGNAALAATNIAFTVNMLAFMPIFGLGIATTTLVGQRLGQDSPELAARATWSAFMLGGGYMVAVSALYVLTPGIFLAMLAAGETADFELMRSTITVLLRFVAAYCLFDAMNVIFSSAIKGAGDTRFVLVTTIFTSPIAVVGAWVGLRLLGLGLLWCWISVTAWITVLGVVYLLRFLGGKWKSMRVIEQPADAEIEPDELPAIEVASA